MTPEQLADLAASAVEAVDFVPYHHGGSGSRTSRRQPVEKRQCANCDSAYTPRSSAGRYCSPVCRQTARAVRYARDTLAAYGQPLPADVDYAVGIKVAHAVSGGYAELCRRLRPVVRAAVIARDHSRCVLCHAPGEEIDHIDGDSEDLDNLRYLCRRCHRRVTAEHLRRIPDGHPALWHYAALLARIHAPTPLRPCDDDWQQP